VRLPGGHLHHEWCWDWYDDYPAGPVTDPIGPRSGRCRVKRGGHWYEGAKACRSAKRFTLFGPDNRYSHLAFRIAGSTP
jgi:formylglycine-generating enzyme required for sulfatase activity